MVVTSFIRGVNNSLPMTSVAFPEEKAKCHAIPLTRKILKTAISFLEGRREEEDDEGEEEEEEDKEDEDDEEDEEEEKESQVTEDFRQEMDEFRVYLQ